ncbi:hypothetical protein DFP81_10925 [Marinomonas pollencensis]|uniref:Uncharacterized protein n=1 Tax=Marinomonas pollencensis TaxID=491954 RepID=A0A3E0DKR4_9GAMM|nr:hypothetical protein DFP81_10925 [Marinomonas pollencensis]
MVGDFPNRKFLCGSVYFRDKWFFYKKMAFFEKKYVAISKKTAQLCDLKVKEASKYSAIQRIQTIIRIF